MRSSVFAVIAIAMSIPAVAGAQSVSGMAVAPVRTPDGPQTGRMIAGPIESRITPGRPYSAESLTEAVQVLADGNRIERKSVTRVFRDSEGRTRREMYGSDGTLRSVAISDPVAHVSYTLDPEKRIAHRVGGNIAPPAVMPTGHAGATARVTTPLAPAAAAGRGGLVRTPAPDDPNVRREDLGTQVVEGVSATGTRTTTIIPAGQIGNAQEIRIVSEQWFSDDLQVLVLTRHADPRSGENTYRLRNIVRAEPDPTLFMIPPDYTVQQRGVRRPQ